MRSLAVLLLLSGCTCNGPTTQPQAGMRELVLRSPGRSDPISAADWNVLAAGAVRAGGDALVCWNRFLGKRPADTSPMSLDTETSELEGTLNGAPAGWSLVGKLAGGSSAATARPPAPSEGLEIVCRLKSASGLSSELRVAGDAPSWLADVTADGATFTIVYQRTAGGDVIGAAQAGDGRFARTYDGTTLGDPVPQP